MPERGQYPEFLLKSSPSPVIMHTDMLFVKVKVASIRTPGDLSQAIA